MKVVLDTNILISGLGWEGKPQQILKHCLNSRFKFVISQDILNEISQVLFRKKFDFIDKDKKDEFILLLSELAEVVSPRHKLNICRDKDDNKFIELALTANANILVSGDEDLLAIQKYKQIDIISADEFLRLLDCV